MNIQLTLARRYLSGRKLRTGLTTLAVVFGVMLIFGLNGLLPAFVESFRQNILAATGQVDLAVSTTTGAAFEQTVVAEVSAINGVGWATSSLSHPIALPLTDGQAAQSLLVIGVDLATVGNVRPYRMAAGRFLETGDNQATVITQSQASQNNLQVGDSLTLPSADGSRQFTIVGILDVLALPGSVPVTIPLPAAQELFNEPGRINLIEVRFSSEADPEQVKAAVQATLGDHYQMTGLQSGTELLANLQLGQAAFNMFGVMALIMGSFIIFNTFRTSIAERQRDIGMLRAVGASRQTIVGVVLFECLLQGILGTLIGLVAGYAFVVALMSLTRPLFEEFLRISLAGPRFSPAVFIMAISLGVGVTVAGGLLPAVWASRIEPLEALRPLTAEVSHKQAGRSAKIGAGLIILSVLTLLNSSLAALGALLFLIGLVLVAPALVSPIAQIMGGLLALAFAREGQLAQGNLARQPGRAAITASAMMIGLAIVVAMLGMISSLFDGFFGYVDKSLGADFLVMPASIVLSSGNVGASPQLAAEIRDLPSVAEVTTLRLARTLANESPIQLIGIDPQTYPVVSGLEFTNGETGAYQAIAAGRNLIVNGIFASQHQVTVGDELVMQTPAGEQSYRVVAIGTDYLNAKLATGYISQANLESDFGQVNDLLLMANGQEGVDPAGVQADLQQVISHYPAFTLFDSISWSETQRQTFDAAFSMMYLLMVVLTVPSLIALLNTLAINVLERTREIGMIRAVGGTQRQIKRMILAESLLLTAIGTSFGILSGLWLGYALVGALNVAGFVVPYNFPYSGVLASVAVGLLIGVVAALIPARQAARLEIVAALRYE